MVLECKGWSGDVKAKVAEAHPSERIKRLYTPPEASWKRKFVSGCDEGEKDEPAKPPEPPEKKQQWRVDWCDDARAEAIILAITTFLVGCALPFTIVESIFFIEMITTLNSAFIKFLPKREAFRRTWAPKIFESTVTGIDKMWASLGNPLRTFGFDGFKTEAGTHVINCTETSGDKTAFKSCIDPGERCEDAKFYADLMEKELRAGAEAAGRSVEETYAGVVADNVSYNRNAFDAVELIFPFLFFFGCIAHCFSLLCSDMNKIPEFAALFADARSLSVFIKGHKYVLLRFKAIIGSRGQMLVLYPDTRFAYADLTVSRVIANQVNLQTLVDHTSWPDLEKGIASSVVGPFKSKVNDLQFFKKLEAMHAVTGPMTKATHHIEACGAKASWVLPLCGALMEDVIAWESLSATVRYFTVETRGAVKESVIARWMGKPPLQVGLKKSAHVLATFLDPYTTPPAAMLPIGWESECRAALSKFYEGSQLESAVDELKELVLRRGSWGEVIEHKQMLIRPPENMVFANKVERVIWQQKKMGQTANDWQLTGGTQFPFLAPVAVRLAVVAIQSADVERSCKAHKIIHTKARNRLYTKTVQLLLFAYINLRLLNKCTAEMGDFLMQSLSACDDEQELAAGERETTDEPEEEVMDMTLED